MIECFLRRFRYLRELSQFDDLPMLGGQPLPTPAGHPDHGDAAEFAADMAWLAKAGRKLWAAAELDRESVTEHPMLPDYARASALADFIGIQTDILAACFDEGMVAWRSAA